MTDISNWTLGDDTEAVQFLDEHGKNLNTWEADFVESCAKRVNRMRPLSLAQRAKLQSIIEERIEND